MPTINAACCACAAYGPVAMLATIGHTRQIALCRACADTPAALRAFAERFRHADDPIDPVLAANRFLAGRTSVGAGPRAAR